MYTPQFRFALLISILVIFGTSIQVIYTYILGDAGLNLNIYFAGVMSTFGATIGGVFFIWLCSKFITFNGLKSTGFEAGYSDEYGTNFVFNKPISLSKFLPEIITKPKAKSISDLESEIIGFLICYKNTPMDLTDPKCLSIHDHSVKMWNVSKKLKNTNSLHHIACLSKYLGLTYVYKEKRKISPLWQFWSKDKVSYSKRCLFHGGLSSFILSTMPSFKNLDDNSKRLLLIAVRFADQPSAIPQNCDPLAFHIYETIHKAEYKIKIDSNQHNANDDNLNPANTMQFKQEVKNNLQSCIKKLNLNPKVPINQADGTYLGLGQALIKTDKLLMQIASHLNPDLRSELNLWSVNVSNSQPFVAIILEAVNELKLIETEFDEQPLKNDLNNFVIDDFLIKDALLLKLEKRATPVLREFLDSLPEFNSEIILEKNEEDIIKEINLRSDKIDKFIESLYT